MTTKLYSALEVASLLGVQLDTLYRYSRKGKLRGLKIGKLWRFAEADVEEFLQGHRYLVVTPDRRATLLPDLLHQAARSGQPGGVVCGATSTSYADLDLLSDCLARALVDKGIQPGDRVLVVLPNSTEFVIACFAVWKARGIVVPEDTAIRPTNLLHILRETEPTALIVDRNVAVRLEGMRGVLSPLRTVFIKDQTFSLSGFSDIEVESLDGVLEHKDKVAPLAVPGASPKDVASITYTSGSTGTPKGVVHTHESWLAGAAFTRDYLGLSASDKIIIPLPLHHAYAFRQILAYALAAGTIVIAADIYQALRAMREQRPTALVLVPAACNIMLDHFTSILREADGFLRYLEVGSAPLGPDRLGRFRELLPTTPIHLPYGLTEARVGFLKPGTDGFLNRIGQISPGLALQVVDNQGQPVAKGQTGEIVLRGNGLMKGYWRPSSGEAEVHHRDEQWFRTGDLGRIDADGEIALLGRMDDVLKVGGRKVNPFEVEAVLNSHPIVVEAVVAGLPDPRGILEQELHAYVVLRRGATVSEAELLSHCRQQLEPYKVPAGVHFRLSLPKSSVGKVQRHVLANEQFMRAITPTKEQCHASAD